MMNQTPFAALLDEQRERRRKPLSLAQLARNIGVNPGTLWRWRSGQFRPGQHWLRLLSKELRVPQYRLRASLDAAESRDVDFSLDTAEGDLITVTVDSTLPAQGGYFAKGCALSKTKEFDPFYTDDLKDPLPAAVLARMEDGNVFEDTVGAQIAHLDDIVIIPACDRTRESKRNRERLTVEAMEAGVQLIWNARLPVEDGSFRVSEPDMLVRDGDGPGYLGTDVKHHKPLSGKKVHTNLGVSVLTNESIAAPAPNDSFPGKPERGDAMQLVHYWHALNDLGFAGRKVGGVIGKPLDGQLRIVWFDLVDTTFTRSESGSRSQVSVWTLYAEEFTSRLAAATAAKRRPATGDAHPIRPERRPECGECVWRTNCNDELTRARDVTLVYGVTPSEAKPLREAGVETVPQLATMCPTTAGAAAVESDIAHLVQVARTGTYPAKAALSAVVDPDRGYGELYDFCVANDVDTVGDLAGFDDATLNAIAAGSKAKKAVGLIDQARVTLADRIHLKRGVNRLELPSYDIEIDVDMENDPDGDNIYMWGTLTTLNLTKMVAVPEWLRQGYKPFIRWTGNPADEAVVFAEFWGWLEQVHAWADENDLSVQVYYYTNAEVRCVRHIVRSHSHVEGVPSSSDAEDRLAESWTDQAKVLKDFTLWPTAGMGLKDVAKNVRFLWRDTSPSGLDSVLWYRDGVRGETPEIRAEMRSRVLAYNEDDVAAQKQVREFLRKLTNTFDADQRLANVAALDARFGRRAS